MESHSESGVIPHKLPSISSTWLKSGQRDRTSAGGGVLQGLPRYRGGAHTKGWLCCVSRSLAETDSTQMGTEAQWSLWTAVASVAGPS